MGNSFPITRDIICMHCGHKGMMDIHDDKDDGADGRLFIHLGHNIFSGDLHYQCPACGIVLLVEPMLALGKRVIRAMPQMQTDKEMPWRKGVLRGLMSRKIR